MIDDSIEKSGTIYKIMQFHQNRRQPKFSPYVSMKNLGKGNLRQAWNDFRWISKSQMLGRIVKLVETGLREEPLILQDLRAIGCTVIDLDPQGQQTFLRGVEGHLVGARDAIVLGLEEHPNDWVLIDAKTSNLKNFEKILAKGIQKIYPEYVTQLILYMGYSSHTYATPLHKILDEWYDFKIAAVVIKCKDDERMYIEYIHFDKNLFSKLISDARKVIYSPYPLDVCGYPEDFMSPCKFCQHKPVCHDGAMPEVNCRTCIHSKPIEGGKWHCDLRDIELSKKAQLEGCQAHLFIPELLIEYEALYAAKEGQEIAYKHKKYKTIILNGIESNPNNNTFSSKDWKEWHEKKSAQEKSAK